LEIRLITGERLFFDGDAKRFSVSADEVIE
jgi:hypothetical protein